MEDRMHHIGDSADTAGSRNLLTIFRRRIWIMIPVAVLILVLAGLYAVIQPQIYEASAWMLVSGGNTIGSSGGERAEILTEADVWRSLQSDLSMHIRLIRRAEMAQEVKDVVETEIAASPKQMAQILDVSKVPGASSNLLALTYTSEDPEKAQAVANAWAQAYEEDSRQRATLSTETALTYVQNQISDVEQQLRTMEEQMASLEQEYLESGINVASTGENMRVTALLDQISRHQVEIDALQAQISRTQQRLESEAPEIEEVQEAPSARARAIEEQLSQLHIEVEEKLGEYYEDSPEVQSLRDEITRLEQQRDNSDEMVQSSVTTEPNPVYQNAQDTLIDLYGQLDAARAAHAELRSQLAEAKALAAMAPVGSIEYNELMRKVRGLQSVHSTLLTRLYELQLERATAVAPVQVVREAELPTDPVSPQYPAIIGVGLAAALLLAAFAAVVVDQIDDTFADPDEIGTTLGERLVGVLPEFEETSAHEVQVPGFNAPPRTPFANAITMLASTVRIEMSQRDLSSLSVTSSGRSEGKSLTAANVAASLANAGENVLLIDCDLHRPRVHEIFDLPRDPGLSNLLVDEIDPDEVTNDTPFPNLRVITSGPLPPSPVDLLASTRGQQVIEELNKAADYVVWDMPPAGFLADATVVGHRTDRTLFVVGNNARRSAVRQTVQNLRQVGIQIVGIAANRVGPQGGTAYYYYEQYEDDEGKRKKK